MGIKNLKDLVKDIVWCFIVYEGIVVGLLCDLESIIVNYLVDGYNVKLGELGIFLVILICCKVMDKSEICVVLVYFDNIKFKFIWKFCKEVWSKGKLEWVEYGFWIFFIWYLVEECFVWLINYLKEYFIIICKEYCVLIGLLKIKVGSELC